MSFSKNEKIALDSSLNKIFILSLVFKEN